MLTSLLYFTPSSARNQAKNDQRLMKTGLNNVVLPTLLIVVNIIEPESGVTMLNNIVDNTEQCGQQNTVQSCFHHPEQVDHFFSVRHVTSNIVDDRSRNFGTIVV